MPKETGDAPSEMSVPREDVKASEYNDDISAYAKSEAESMRKAKAEQKIERRHKYLKKYLLMPVVGVITGLSILSASIGFDPLGIDIFGIDQNSIRLKAGFPDLPNLEPDRNGDYAWKVKSPETSEEYVRFRRVTKVIEDPDGYEEPLDDIDQDLDQETDQDLDQETDQDIDQSEEKYIEYYGQGYVEIEDTTFIVAGGHFRNNLGVVEETLPGCSYDRKTNTLTLENFSGEDYMLDTNLMGNGFTIKLIGENTLGYLEIWGASYGGSVVFTGDGSLAVNRDRFFDMGLVLEAERSMSCIMVDDSVTLEFFGYSSAIAVFGSTEPVGLYVLKPVSLMCGVFERVDSEEDIYMYAITDGEGYAFPEAIFQAE